MDRFDEIREKAIPLLEPYGLLKLGVFGSYARGDFGPESDIDLLVQLERPRRKPIGWGWFRLQDEIGGMLGRKVEMVSWDAVKKYMWPYIADDLVMLYDKAA